MSRFTSKGLDIFLFYKGLLQDFVIWVLYNHTILYSAHSLNYSTETYKQLSDPDSGIQLMSDEYILENVLNEIIGR